MDLGKDARDTLGARVPNTDLVTQHSEAGACYSRCQEFPRRVEKSENKHPELELRYSSRCLTFANYIPGKELTLGGIFVTSVMCVCNTPCGGVLEMSAVLFPWLGRHH